MKACKLVKNKEKRGTENHSQSITFKTSVPVSMLDYVTVLS